MPKPDEPDPISPEASTDNRTIINRAHPTFKHLYIHSVSHIIQVQRAFISYQHGIDNMGVKVVQHPLVKVHLSVLRNKTTDAGTFR